MGRVSSGNLLSTYSVPGSEMQLSNEESQAWASEVLAMASYLPSAALLEPGGPAKGRERSDQGG